MDSQLIQCYSWVVDISVTFNNLENIIFCYAEGNLVFSVILDSFDLYL